MGLGINQINVNGSSLGKEEVEGVGGGGVKAPSVPRLRRFFLPPSYILAHGNPLSTRGLNFPYDFILLYLP